MRESSNLETQPISHVGTATTRAGASLLHRIWHNRPVSDEAAFLQEFRSHSFGFVLVVTWTLCVVRTGIIAYQLLIASGARQPLSQVLISTALLYWLPPVIFTAFKPWSRRHYYWVLDVLYAFYFAMAATRASLGPTRLDETNVLLLVLIITSVIFVRIPFRHALLLIVGATAVVDVIAVAHSDFASAFKLLFSSTFILVMALYASWGIEERERWLFEQRMKAERAATQAFVASSEKQRLHDQLSSLYSQRELLIRGLHHDANQSLHVMGSALLGLRQKIEANPFYAPLREEVAAVALGAADLDGLIAGMYDLVKLGKYEPCYAPLAVNKLLDHVTVKFSSVAAEKGLRFTVKRRKDAVFLNTDATALERIIGNLVSNALKYTVKGGVVVGTVKQGNTLRIDIWDTGVGIPRSQKDAIFHEFVRLEPIGAGDAKGLGLGLAIVKLLREKLAGHYLEHASTVGRGSRFSISVPLAEAPIMTEGVPDSTLSAVGLAIDRLYVVVVEDNPTVQKSIAALLRGAGYAIEDNVRFASCVAQVVRIFDDLPDRAPNIVVCDFRLRDGETANHVIQLIDARFHWERVPVVVYTAEIEPAVDVSRAHTRVIVKTGNPSALLEEMERAVVAARSEPRVIGSD